MDALSHEAKGGGVSRARHRRRPQVIVHRSVDHRRTRFNHREHAFATAWERENEARPGIGFGYGILQGLMVNQRKLSHQQHPLYYSRHIINNRDAAIVATVVQWLATNCGMDFLRSALKACGYLIVPDQSWREQPDICPLCKGRGRKMREAGVMKCGWCRHPIRVEVEGEPSFLINAILAACAEERREAMTECAAICRKQPGGNGFDCSFAIESARDEPLAKRKGNG